MFQCFNDLESFFSQDLIAVFIDLVIQYLSMYLLETDHVAKIIFQSDCNFFILVKHASLCFSDNFLLSLNPFVEIFFSKIINQTYNGQARGHLPASSIYTFKILMS